MLARFPGPVTIPGRNYALLVFIAIGGVLIVGGSWGGGDLLKGAVSGVGVIAMGLLFWMAAPRKLILDADGFELRAVGLSQRERWSEVADFQATSEFRALDIEKRDPVPFIHFRYLHQQPWAMPDGGESRGKIRADLSVRGDDLAFLLEAWQRMALGPIEDKPQTGSE